MKNEIINLARKMGASSPDAGIEVRFWDGDSVNVGDATRVTLWFKTRNALADTLANGFLGFGEAYMAGDIEIEGDIRYLFEAGHLAGVGDMSLSLWEKVRFLLRFLRERSSLRRAKKNIAFHYDLGNDLYELFLDPTMAYTCAYFKSPHDTLEQAQVNKYEHVCRKLQLRQGETLADLGCGWGGLLIHAAQNHGVSGIGVTLSQNQFEFANERIKKLGLQDRIQVYLKDYRETPGVYDKVVSLGMLEHVGKEYVRTCARKIRQLLKPGGLGLIHAIMNDTPFPDDPWTMKYIFPGSHIPALDHLIRELADNRLSVQDVENLRLHYVRTIELWLENFERNRENVERMLDAVFFRCWRLYFNVAVTSFSHGGNRLFQVLFTNGLHNELPLTRSHLYHE